MTALTVWRYDTPFGAEAAVGLHMISQIDPATTARQAGLAKEGARLPALDVKMQLAIQALRIANQGPSLLLALFR